MRAAVFHGVELAFDIEQQDRLATRRKDQLAPTWWQILHSASGQQRGIRQEIGLQHGHAPWRAATRQAAQPLSLASAG